MTLPQEHTEYIKTAFQNMRSKDDLLCLLNYSKKLVYGDEAIPFEIRNINYNINRKVNKKRYIRFSIKKKSGAERTIHAPERGLKAIQKCLNMVFQTIYTVSPSATGFVPGKSIVDNARVHTGSLYVYNIDLKDFFPSIDAGRIWGRLQHPPFSLNEKSGKKELANIITWLCCHEMEVERFDNETKKWEKETRSVLPQGAPTSPTLTNIICQQLDFYLNAVAKRFGLKYSRYADDITFSSMHNVYQKDGDFLKEIQRIISEQRFHIKESKTRLQKQGYRQEVTGLLVNEKANVQKRYIKQLRMWLYYWERYGYATVNTFFSQSYLADKEHVKKGRPDMANVIGGKLDYLKMVKGGENALYLKLKGRFNSLAATKIKPKAILEETITTETNTNQVRVSLEVYQSPIMNEKLYNSITIPKNTTLPSTLILSNSVIKEEAANKTKMLFPHNPIYTISFLKKFKIGDGSGFKELVHDIILTHETINDILNRVKSHPNFILHYKGERVANVSFLNLGIVMSTRQLIDLFEKEGLPFYQISHTHPFNNDIKYTNYAKQFKKKYRYGSGSEYGKLQTDIINIFDDQKVPLNSVLFMPDERKFNIRSSFFTWQPSIYNGIRYIVQGIADHSNINGELILNSSDKKILIEVERIRSETLSFVELRICDCESVSKNESEMLLTYLKGSYPYQSDFRNLCDWVVECDFLDESTKRLNLLIAPEYSHSFQEIEELPEAVGGFKHILRFYDSV